MHDVVVVGGGTAGCSLALLLARLGHEVLVLERDGSPQGGYWTEHLGPAAVVLLDRWGVLDRLVATGCPPADGLAVWAGPNRFELENPSESPLTYSPRRAVLVSVLSAAAMRAGVHIERGVTARDAVWESGRASGVVSSGVDGRSVYHRGSFVVGADGRSSLVARVVGADAYDERAPTNCCFHAYWRRAAAGCPEVFLTDRRAVAVCPTDGGLAWVVAARPVDDWATFKRSPEPIYREQIRQFPTLARRFEAATRESRFGGSADLATSLRVPWGPGWALVGDAGRPHDGSLCLGASGDLIDVELLAVAINDGLTGRLSMNEALAGYHRYRDAELKDAQDAVCGLGSYEWGLDDVPGIVARAEAARVRAVQRVLSRSREPQPRPAPS